MRLTNVIGWISAVFPRCLNHAPRARQARTTREGGWTAPGPPHTRRVSGTLISFILVAGCTASPAIEPLATTYPRGRTEQVKNIVNLPLPISLSAILGLSGGNAANPVNEKIAYSSGTPVLQGTYTETKVGDTAEVEIWIVPRNSGEANEKGLLARLQEGGQRSCNGAYRIKSTKYYYGTEATLRFLGIHSPAVRANYRCTASRKGVSDSNISTVANLASRFRDAAFFDISSFAVPQDQAAIVAGLRAEAIERSMEVVDEGPSGKGYYLVASRENNARRRVLPENLVALVSTGNGGGKVTVLYMTYERTYHRRGVAGAGTKRPGFIREPQPTNRKFAYDASRALVEQVLSRLGG